MMPAWPNGETLVVPIVGEPIAQVKSPAAITAALRARGLNALVVPALVAPGDFAAFVAGFRATRNSPALILTVPHKAAGLAFCDHLTDRARLAGSVNFIGRGRGGWSGDNTDGAAFLDGIAAQGGDVRGRRVLLVGAGGAGSAIAGEFLARGAGHVAVHDIDTGRRNALVGRLDLAYPGRVDVGSSDPLGFDVVANATPLGMRPTDPLPVLADRLTSDQLAGCVVTSPEVSPFIAAARAAGCRTMTGTAMFLAQEKVLTDAILAAWEETR